MTDASIRAELARTEVELVLARDHVVVSVLALREEVARAADWREWVRRRPGTLLAAALAVGFFVGKRH